MVRKRKASLTGRREKKRQAESVQRSTERQTEAARAQHMEQNREQHSSARSQLTQEQAEQTREQNREQHSSARSQLTQEQAEQIQEQDRQQHQRARANKASYRTALKDEPPDELSLGEMNVQCTSCHAFHFKTEEAGKDKTLFKNCCHNGQVSLPKLKAYPPELRALLEGGDKKAKNFRENIRSYNSSVAFASMCASIANIPRGPYVFRIHGQVYHMVGPLEPREGQPRRYAQLYIVDSVMALQERMGQAANEKCLQETMDKLDRILRDVSPFPEQLKFIHDVLDEQVKRDRPQNVPPPQLTLVFKEAEAAHKQTGNLPTVSEVAALFAGEPDEELKQRELQTYGKDGRCKTISVLNRLADPLIYPVLFPQGDTGWDPHLQQTNLTKRVSQLQFYSHRLAVRAEFSALHRGGKLFQQYIVDQYTKVEQDRLNYIIHNQKKLRVDQYSGLIDYIGSEAERRGVKPGKLIILPSSFDGGPRAMQQNYQDAMSMVRKLGKPDLFITFTCNPAWREITEALQPSQRPNDRPDIVSRVFNLKKDSLIDDLMKNDIFGQPVAIVYVIEFQKRGLPHAHILLMLASDDKPKSPEMIDQMITAELPNPETDPQLCELVKKHMIHGPCGDANKNSPCMENEQCKKHYPKDFCEETSANVGGYPQYRRRKSEIIATVGKHTVDNQWVVPHNKYLLRKYNAHINVEACTSFECVKYLFKYVFKGHDSASVTINTEKPREVQDASTSTAPQLSSTLEQPSTSAGPQLQYNEVDAYVNERYVSPPESIWRLFEFPLHHKSHTVIRLAVHLPNEQSVFFHEGEQAQALEREVMRQSTLTAYFDLNRTNPTAQQYRYSEIPEHFVFDRQGKWNTRKRGTKIVGRVFTVSPRDVERFYLRLLLLYSKGATSFDDIKTVDGTKYNTFYEAARASHLIADDQEWIQCLEEASTFQMPPKLRDLFSVIFLCGEPHNAQALWETFSTQLSEDFTRYHNATLQQALNLAWWDIEDKMNRQGRSLFNFGLAAPGPRQTLVQLQQLHQMQLGTYEQLNDEQRRVADEILSSVNHPSDQARCFFVDGPGGTGKTFLYGVLYKMLTEQNKSIATVAWTGIAANLLPNGCTVHSKFKLPVPLLENSTCSIKAGTNDGDEMKKLDMIIWDEAPMAPKSALRAVEILFRDLMSNEIPFGGKVMVLGGDFRQILPVVRYGSTSEQISACIKSSTYWHHFNVLHLHQNMRTLETEHEFAKWLLKLGDGQIEHDQYERIQVPQSFLCSGMSTADLIHDTFGSEVEAGNTEVLQSRAILCPTNSDALQLSNSIIEMIPGNPFIYSSIDTVESDNPTDVTNFPTEFLNSMTPSGMPPHLLILKKGASVMLLRNLSTRDGLCNGTRMIVEEMKDNLVVCRIATGTHKNEVVFIPRIPLKNMDPYGIDFSRRQFPLRLSFAMTINKAQGQTFQRIGLFLPQPVFTHGQLYVAFSRVRAAGSIKVLLPKADDGSSSAKTQNIVFRRVLQ